MYCTEANKWHSVAFIYNAPTKTLRLCVDGEMKDVSFSSSGWGETPPEPVAFIAVQGSNVGFGHFALYSRFVTSVLCSLLSGVVLSPSFLVVDI